MIIREFSHWLLKKYAFAWKQWRGQIKNDIPPLVPNGFGRMMAIVWFSMSFTLTRKSCQTQDTELGRRLVNQFSRMKGLVGLSRGGLLICRRFEARGWARIEDFARRRRIVVSSAIESQKRASKIRHCHCLCHCLCLSCFCHFRLKLAATRRRKKHPPFYRSHNLPVFWRQDIFASSRPRTWNGFLKKIYDNGDEGRKNNSDLTKMKKRIPCVLLVPTSPTFLSLLFSPFERVRPVRRYFNERSNVQMRIFLNKRLEGEILEWPIAVPYPRTSTHGPRKSTIFFVTAPFSSQRSIAYLSFGILYLP